VTLHRCAVVAARHTAAVLQRRHWPAEAALTVARHSQRATLAPSHTDCIRGRERAASARGLDAYGRYKRRRDASDVAAARPISGAHPGVVVAAGGGG